MNITFTRFDTLKHTMEITDIRMSRTMWWEKEYIENPYMRALPMKEMNERFHDIIANSVDITDGGKLGLRGRTSRIEWMRYCQHVLVEARNRELPYPLFLDKRYSPKEDDNSFMSSVRGDHSTRAAGAVVRRLSGRVENFHAIKYGEYQYMKKLLATGEMLIQSSRGFDKDSYNEARRDDENSVSIFGVDTMDGTAIPAYDVAGRSDQDRMTTFSSSTDRDYMLYCMAGTLSSTLFAHFGQRDDSCVIIHDIDEFVQRVDHGTRELFPPENFIFAHGWVTYFDPLGAIPITPPIPEGSEVPIPFLKHFRHAYQDEYRYVWFPRAPKKDGLSLEKVWIGCLHDIAEIIRI
ncbi:MAG: hypothetical protein OXE73_00030 [Gammaproteobacteria bacterium]|nr:hypothetical protein [Gammaproteobacteria bacterium]